ncbi:hypothetical protein NDU88_001834 [Pleurodeles waltl]|uniref:Uncharacterized protein n=1 Tax=Pleurodeles waltl TaxID=8319 RepID=A0AAV7NBW5_PLEWA|nr:hypothetical protein NDU88_001834 [Pleurodeles waltl]
MPTTSGPGVHLKELAKIERDLHQAEIHVAENTVLALQLRQLRTRRHEAESTLRHQDYRTGMALQHAQVDQLGKVLAWLLREVHHGTPAMSITMPDGTMSTSQLAINDTFRAYYQQLYEQPAGLGVECTQFLE